MNDLIEMSCVLDTIENYGTLDGYSDKVELMETIKKLPSVRWIPVTERLPGAYQHVLRTVKRLGWDGEKGYVTYLDVDIGTYNTNDGSIVAWMPLPEPYEVERKEE